MHEFDIGTIESIGYALASCCSHEQLSRVFVQCRFDPEINPGIAKPKRIAEVLSHEQRKVGNPNCVLRFIQEALAKSRYVGRQEEFEMIRENLNEILSLVGLEYGKDCQFKKVQPAETLDEVGQRVWGLRRKLSDRNIHSEVLKYCTREFLAEDYFHAILEASKGLCQRVRDMSGLATDGTELMQTVFSIKNPLLAFNTLQTESEQSEHKGISSLMQGCCQFLRNPRAHAPRVLWNNEVDVAEALTLISMLHKVLDRCTRVPNMGAV